MSIILAPVGGCRRRGPHPSLALPIKQRPVDRSAHFAMGERHCNDFARLLRVARLFDGAPRDDNRNRRAASCDALSTAPPPARSAAYPCGRPPPNSGAFEVVRASGPGQAARHVSRQRPGPLSPALSGSSAHLPSPGLRPVARPQRPPPSVAEVSPTWGNPAGSRDATLLMSAHPFVRSSTGISLPVMPVSRSTSEVSPQGFVLPVEEAVPRRPYVREAGRSLDSENGRLGLGHNPNWRSRGCRPAPRPPGGGRRRTDRPRHTHVGRPRSDARLCLGVAVVTTRGADVAVETPHEGRTNSRAPPVAVDVGSSNGPPLLPCSWLSRAWTWPAGRPAPGSVGEGVRHRPSWYLQQAGGRLDVCLLVWEAGSMLLVNW